MGTVTITCTHCNTTHDFAGDYDTMTCPSCNNGIEVDAGIAKHMAGNSGVQTLARGPSIRLSRDAVPMEIRPIIDTIAPPQVKRGDWPGLSARGDRIIVYLVGDERRAVDLFITEYREFVDAAMQSPHGNPLKEQWTEGQYQLLLEQWHWTQA